MEYQTSVLMNEVKKANNEMLRWMEEMRVSGDNSAVVTSINNSNEFFHINNNDDEEGGEREKRGSAKNKIVPSDSGTPAEMALMVWYV